MLEMKGNSFYYNGEYLGDLYVEEKFNRNSGDPELTLTFRVRTNFEFYAMLPHCFKFRQNA